MGDPTNVDGEIYWELMCEPWGDGDLCIWAPINDSDDGVHIASVSPDDVGIEQRDANARLIVRAVNTHGDLVASLEELTRIVESRFEGLEIVALVPGELRAAVTKAKAVLDEIVPATA